MAHNPEPEDHELTGKGRAKFINTLLSINVFILSRVLIVHGASPRQSQLHSYKRRAREDYY